MTKDMRYKNAFIIDDNKNDPTVLNLKDCKIVFDFNNEDQPILKGSISLLKLLNEQLKKGERWQVQYNIKNLNQV